MKLSLPLLASSGYGKKIFGCDPAELGHYEMVEDDCKKFKGMHTELGNQPGFEDKILEQRGNQCRRQCMYGNHQATVMTRCKCVKNTDGSFSCWYESKFQKTLKGWYSFDHQLADGSYPVDKWGYSGYQPECVPPSQNGEWGEWSDWGACNGECGLGTQTRTRECSTNYCGDEPSTESRKCVSYSDYSTGGGHVCNNKNNWLFKDSEDSDYRCTLRQNGSCGTFSKQPQYYNDGHYCVMPSFGGWPRANQNFAIDGDNEGENVQMGIECDDENGTKTMYDQGSHVITGLNVKCKLVCRGDKPDAGNMYMPETLYWHKFQCQTPLPIQLTKPINCYKDMNTGAYLSGECLPDWIEQGLGMSTQSSLYSNWSTPPQPWYFITQNWPNSGCSYGCGSDKNLNQIHELIDTCYKVEGTEMPTCEGAPPLTAQELAAGTDPNALSWSCDDGNNAGSICTKQACPAGYGQKDGSPNQTKMICHCSQKEGSFGCAWKVAQTAPNPAYSNNENPQLFSCLKNTCEGNPKRWPDTDGMYRVACYGYDNCQPDEQCNLSLPKGWDFIENWKSSAYQIPLQLGQRCFVTCSYGHDIVNFVYGYPRDYQMTDFYETGVNQYNIECKQTANGAQWVPESESGGFTKCEPVCMALGNLDNLNCTDGFRIGSTCRPKCPDGQSPGGKGKDSKLCKTPGYGGWSGGSNDLKQCQDD